MQKNLDMYFKKHCRLLKQISQQLFDVACERRRHKDKPHFHTLAEKAIVNNSNSSDSDEQLLMSAN